MNINEEKEREIERERQRGRKFLVRIAWLLGIAMLIGHVCILRSSILVITATYESEVALGFIWVLAVMIYIFAWHAIVRILMKLPRIEEASAIPFILLGINWTIACAAGIWMLGEFIYE